MAFNVKIQNLGKLDDAEIRIDRFTVFAGPNNSGKSFVSKTVYSVIKALSENFLNNYFLRLINNLDSDLFWSLRYGFFEEEDSAFEQEFQENVQQLASFISECRFRSLAEVNEVVPAIVARIDTLINIGKNLTNNMDSAIDSAIDSEDIEDLDSLLSSLRELRNDIDGVSGEVIFERARSLELEQKFIDNFQVSKFSQLLRVENKPFVLDIDSIGRIKFSEGKLESDLHDIWLRKLHRFSTILYFESPIYLKLMKVLERVPRIPRFMRRRRPVSQIPGYFHDLVNTLEFEYTGDIAFPELYEKLTSGDIMGGRLIIGKDRSIYYQENGRRFSLPITATGVANLGMLALLIERKALDTDSMIFIDEPEAHLHPAWQVFMAESLFELARQGVHVVIATHSIDILKWLEVHVKKNPRDKDFIALNQFPSPTIESNYDFEEKLSSIKHKLSEPFANLYVDGL